MQAAQKDLKKMMLKPHLRVDHVSPRGTMLKLTKCADLRLQHVAVFTSDDTSVYSVIKWDKE